jgi:FKBP-type peptidyl-prolyl cis-trans isomerase FkpA
LKAQFIKGLTAVAVVATIGNACKPKDVKYVKFDNLIEYKHFETGSGDKLKDGNFVLMNITKKIGDSVFYKSLKEYPEGTPNPIKITKDAKDFANVLAKLRLGDSLVMRFNADSVFGGAPPPFYKKGDEVIQTFKIVRVFKNDVEFQNYMSKKEKEASAADDKIISEYAAKKGLTLQKTSTGVYYQITTPGAGPMAAVGQELSMKYTGMTLDGTKFDSNVDPAFQHTEPFKFTLGEGRVIPGWDDGLTVFNKGAKGVLVIPSALAYGAQGMPPKIAPNSVLHFDVELLDMKAPPAAKAPKGGIPQMPQQAPMPEEAAPVQK